MSFFHRKVTRTTAVSNTSNSKTFNGSNVFNNSSRDLHDSLNVPDKKRVAIIGSGVSGLTCAHYLAKKYDVTIFEANDYIGGHVNTIDVTLQSGKKSKSKHVETSAIDTGFIVFNERTYPNFFRLLHDLQVPFQATDMSFSVKNVARNFEYNGHTLNTLLSQRKNVLNPKFWQFIKDILQFNKHIRQLRQDFDAARMQGQDVSVLTKQTLGSYLDSKHYGKLFTDNYLLPMVSAIWSTSLKEVQDFPLVFFAQFFDNHGLLEVVNRPQWFTIKGGSKQYVNKLVTRFVKAGGTIKVNSPVATVSRSADKVMVKNKTDGNTQTLIFDEVIFACHADTALRLLADASHDETEILSHFHFTNNTAVLHTDSSVLPKKPLAWASWNYLIDNKIDSKNEQTTSKPVLTYHMNILQRLTKQHNYLVTLNPATLNKSIDEAQVIKQIDYSHPVYNNEMIEAQTQWSRISGSGLHTHFCGAYWFNGFHEDGVRSGLRVCQALGSNIDIKDEVDPSHLPDAENAHTPFRYKDLPVKSDKNARKLQKRQVVTATTNQELVDYIATLRPNVPEFNNKKKRGFFSKRIKSKVE
ncbi:NAD(P)/FAD-dependent oxidoreductase [Psychrobacter sp. GP33]|uniref:NAD(P)/FAD-dependent oxidoreductase n=1 Tax=Psychrobacter sp. GP33 TaxID=2758709 RepID=UPI0015F95B9F|nr:FAD-dependent oxidoreductase [Psychrobacter sp. GP33]